MSPTIIEYHDLDRRLSVAEVKIEHIDDVLDSQREIMDRLVDVTQGNGRDLSKLETTLSRKADATMLALVEHSAEESKDRAANSRRMLGTLIVSLATLGAVVLGHLLTSG